MSAIAIGAWFPEWEPNRIASNKLWQSQLREFDAAILVTGSAHTGFPLVEAGIKYVAWVSATVGHDRRARLIASNSLSIQIERLGLPAVLRAEHAVLANASAVLAVSLDAATAIEQVTGVMPEVLPFPIDTSKFNPGLQTDEKKKNRILFVGRAGDPRKRIGLFLEAFAEFKRREKSVESIASVVSSMPIPKELAEQFQTTMNSVEVIERATEQELIELYRSAKAFVVTSEQEGLGIAAMEAMACGTPVISTRCGGTETFIEDQMNGFLTSSNATDIAARIHAICSDTTLRKELGDGAINTIESKFSERVWNENVLVRIEQLLS